MQGKLETLGILIQIALRNLFASRLKTLIVGGIICFGAVLVVVGTSVLDSINKGMAKSIIGSAAGHLQVYSSESKDALALYGGMTGDVDLKPMEDFQTVKNTVMTVPNVKAVVPMGMAEAMGSSDNEFDRMLERLRASVRKKLAGDASPELARQLAATREQVAHMIVLLEKDMEAAKILVEERSVDKTAAESRAQALAPGFWDDFDRDPLPILEFLENKIAPQAMEGDMIWVRYIGTDVEAYQQSFEKVKIIEGTTVPKGQRGIVFGKLYYDEWLKLKTAHRLDQIRDELHINHKKIATDEKLQRFVKENTTQVREIVIQLDSIKTRALVERLQKALGSAEADLSALLAQLLTTDDQNFEERYQLFYSQVAPMVELYRVRVGDTLTIKAFTKAGYMKSVNVKVYGVCQFEGLEKAAFAGMFSIMDLMSFRDLYGYLTADRAEEIKKLKEASGAKAVSRENAEAELFGASSEVVAEAQQSAFDESKELGASVRVRLADEAQRVYTKDEIERGVALNAAIILKDPELLKPTMKEIQSALDRDGLKVKVVDWQTAAGMVGQLINMFSLALAVAVLIIFVIALVIINNAMVMATLQRVKEIGTLRAIGAQRRFVLSMVGVETVAVGLLFGAIGSLLGAGAVGLLGYWGLPASSQEMYFLYSGPRLHPYLSTGNVVIALVAVLLVSILSALYPALLATRISPVEAMLTEE